MGHTYHIVAGGDTKTNTWPSSFQCTLLISRFGVGRLLIDTNTKQIFKLDYHASDKSSLTKSDLDELLSEPKLKSAKKINVFVDTQKTTLIPTSLFDASYKEAYIAPLFSLWTDEVLLHKQVDDIYSVFAIKKMTYDTLTTRFDYTIELSDVASALSVAYPKILHFDKPFQLIIEVTPCAFVCTLYKNKQLLLSQSLEYKTMEDILHYVASSIALYQIIPSELAISLHGYSTYTSPCLQLLSNYYDQVALIDWPGNMLIPQELRDAEANILFTLVSLSAV